jgi:hypothetical protein
MTDQTRSKEEGQETKQIAVADTDPDVVDVPDPDEDDLDDLDGTSAPSNLPRTAMNY